MGRHADPYERVLMSPIRDLTWAGGEHDFALPIGLLRALQDKCNAGPPLVLQRLAASTWHVDDVIQPIRLGLEGGGMSKEEARKLTEKHVEDKPLALSVLTAQAILTAVLFGPGDDPVGEPLAGEGTTETPSPVDGGASPGSTSPAT